MHVIERKVIKRTVDLDKINDNEDEEEIEIDPETGLPVKKVVRVNVFVLLMMKFFSFTCFEERGHMQRRSKEQGYLTSI